MSVFRALDNLAKEEYFQPYVNSVKIPPDESKRSPSTVSTIPEDVPLETLIAITIYRPGIVIGNRLQQSSQTIEATQNAIALRLQETGLNVNNLRKFKPSVSNKLAIQTRGTLQSNTLDIVRRLANGQRIDLNARELLLRGLDPKTQQLVKDLQDLRLLKQLQDRLDQQQQRLEQQIARYTAIFNAFVNAPDAAISGSLTFLITKLEQLEQLYTAAKTVFLLVKKAYENTKKAVIKALFKDIPRYGRNVKKALSVIGKILKLREIPRIVLFPKRPKPPKVNWSAADFFKKYKLSLKRLKVKNGLFYDKAYQTALEQSGFEIYDPNKDKTQNALRRARNSLRQARAQFQAKQAIRTAAVEQTRNKLIDNVRSVSRTVERQRANILKEYQKAKTAADKARNQFGGRKEYLTDQVVSQLVKNYEVDVRAKNQFGDLPYTTSLTLGGQAVSNITGNSFGTETGYTISDGRVVYTDRTNGKAYVIISAAERLQNLRGEFNNYANKVAGRAIANLGEIQTAANAVKNLTDSYGQLASGLNNKALKQDLLGSIAGEGAAANRISEEAIRKQKEEGGKEELPFGAQQQLTIVEESTKTITTLSRRLRPNDALVEAEVLNRRKADDLGYSSASFVDGSIPVAKTLNGQTIFEAKLTIGYASQSLAGRVRNTPTAQRLDPRFTPPGPVLGLPESLTRSIQEESKLIPITNLLPEQRQEIQILSDRIAQINKELLETVDELGRPISGETKASLRSELLAAQDRIRQIRTPVIKQPDVLQPTPFTALTTPYPGGLYQRGSRGNNVKLIQQRLNITTNPTPRLVEDGIFGTATYNAITNFQRLNNLRVDGVVGQNTWEKLFSELIIPRAITIPQITSLNPQDVSTPLSQITVPLAQARLPQDRVEQSGQIIIVNISRTDSPQGRDGLAIAFEDARRLATNRASQSRLTGTPKINSEYRVRNDISGRTVFEVTYTADYTQLEEVSQEGNLVLRQLNVDVLLQQGITPAQINSQYSPPGPVDENGNVVNVPTSLFTRTSGTARTQTPPTRPRTPAPAPTPPIATPGFDIDQSQSIFGTPRKLSVFEIEALNNRLNSPFISDEEKVRIRQILGVANPIPADLQLPRDPQLEFSQEVTRPNLSVTSAGNRAKLTFNAGRVPNVEYSIDNGRTWTILNPPSRAGDIIINDLDAGIYAARVRGIRADGTKTAPSQPEALIITVSQPVIRRTEPASSTSALVIFDDSVTARDIKNYQFTTRSDNSGWFNALPSVGKGEAVSSPIVVFGLEVDKTYTIRIRAIYKDGSPGNVSNQATLNTFKTRQEGGGLIA